MKNQNVAIALIIAVALLLSASIMSSGLKSFGRSVEKAASSIGAGVAAQRPSNIPTSFRVDLGEIKIGNAGGGGQSFQVAHTGTK